MLKSPMSQATTLSCIWPVCRTIPLGDLNAELTYDINHHASVRLATLAKQAGVKRFIFSSSCSNYGAGGEDLLNEESPFNPVTPYGDLKGTCGTGCRKAGQRSLQPRPF